MTKGVIASGVLLVATSESINTLVAALAGVHANEDRDGLLHHNRMGGPDLIGSTWRCAVVLELGR